MNPSKDPGKVSKKFKRIQLEIPASDFKIGKLWGTSLGRVLDSSGSNGRLWNWSCMNSASSMTMAPSRVSFFRRRDRQERNLFHRIPVLEFALTPQTNIVSSIFQPTRSIRDSLDSLGWGGCHLLLPYAQIKLISISDIGHVVYREPSLVWRRSVSKIQKRNLASRLEETESGSCQLLRYCDWWEYMLVL